MRTITIRQLQRNLYKELEDLPVLVTRRIVTPDRKHKTIPLCQVLPFREDDQDVIEGLYATSEEEAAGEGSLYTELKYTGTPIIIDEDDGAMQRAIDAHKDIEISPIEQPNPPVDTEPQNATVNASDDDEVMEALEQLPENTAIVVQVSGELRCAKCGIFVFDQKDGARHFVRSHLEEEPDRPEEIVQTPQDTQFDGDKIKAPSDFWEKKPDPVEEEKQKRGIFGWFKKKDPVE